MTTNRKALGTLVVNEVRFPIVSMRLAGGKLHIVGTLVGPLAALRKGRHVVRLHGEDGVLCGEFVNVIEWPELYMTENGPDDLELTTFVEMLDWAVSRDATIEVRG